MLETQELSLDSLDSPLCLWEASVTLGCIWKRRKQVMGTRAENVLGKGIILQKNITGL